MNTEPQSIDTAPRDGTYILACNDYEFAVVRWDDDREQWSANYSGHTLDGAGWWWSLPSLPSGRPFLICRLCKQRFPAVRSRRGGCLRPVDDIWNHVTQIGPYQNDEFGVCRECLEKAKPCQTSD